MFNFRWVLGLLICWPVGVMGQGRFDQFTTKFAKTPDQATVLAAGHLGGSGTEYLVGGGFQPDGSVVLVGNAFGPTLDLGVKSTVIGTDHAAPVVWQPKPSVKNGKPELNKDGTPKLLPAQWTDDAATAFIAILDRDLKTIKSVSRLPWGGAGVTSAVVDASGAIYLTGPARDSVAKISPNMVIEPVRENGAKSGQVQRTYLAKFTADGSQLVWGKVFNGFSSSPSVEIDRQGLIQWRGADVRTYETNGTLKRAVTISGGLGGAKMSVSPLDGRIARGGERHWPTGREPYRDPHLYIHEPDGKLKYEFYNWDGPYVGLDNLRLVSDSALRLVKHDPDGNLWFYAWSDGGNSVMYREPYDVRTFAKNFKGLGMSAYAAGVLSCAYIIKLDPKTWQVSGGTLWLAYLKDKDKPNSIWIDSMGFAADGSVCIGGKSAWGLIQTGNAIGNSEPTGPYVSVLSADCTSLRFSSAMPACGKAEVSDGANWGIIQGKHKGRDIVLYLCGAKAKESPDEKALPAPAVNARQPKHAGGELDGYYLLLDLGK